jgi:hypothetical protein
MGSEATTLVTPLDKNATQDEYDAWMQQHWLEHSTLVENTQQLPIGGQQVASLGQQPGAYASLGDFANDAAAAAGGVAVGALYRNGSVVMVRVS